MCICIIYDTYTYICIYIYCIHTFGIPYTPSCISSSFSIVTHCPKDPKIDLALEDSLFWFFPRALVEGDGQPVDSHCVLSHKNDIPMGHM